MTADIELLPSSVAAFTEALKGERGSLDAWLEVNDEREVAAHVEAYTRANVAHATAPLQAEIEALRVRADAMAGEAIKHEARAERLAEALREMLSRAPISYGCNEFHHTKADRHGSFDACLPMQRWHAALDAAGAALRDHDQERKDG